MSSPPAHDPGAATQRDLDPHHALPTPDGSDRTVTDSAHLLPATTSEPAKGSLTRKLVVVAIILGAIAFAWWRINANAAETAATNSKAAAAANRPTPVQTAAVQQKTVPVYLTALGTVTAYNTVTLHTRVDGQLLKVNFQEGQSVKQGQLLLQIDPRPYQAAVDQAIGTLAKDQANLANMTAEAQRYTSLYQAGVVSKESQQAQVSNAGQAVGSIKADEAAIEAAKVNLGYTSIYSPIQGVVGLRQVDPGNIVHAADANGLVVITQIHPIAIIFTLPEDQLPQVQQAMKGGAKLVVEAYDRSDAHKLAAGTLLTIDNQIDTTTGTAKLKAVFDNTDGSLFPNQFVNIRLILRQRENAIVIPTAAIQSGTQGSFVFVMHPGAGKAAAGSGGGGKHGGKGGGAKSASTTPDADASSEKGDGKADANEAPKTPPYHVNVVNVHVDFAEGANSILAAGPLNAGDQVVIDGQEKLNDESNVTPTASPASGGTNGSGGTGVKKGIGANAAPAATPAPGQQGGPGTTNTPGNGGGGPQ
jgi:membrane fusion protein, multidrug efflux system